MVDVYVVDQYYDFVNWYVWLNVVDLCKMFLFVWLIFNDVIYSCGMIFEQVLLWIKFNNGLMLCEI